MSQRLVIRLGSYSAIVSLLLALGALVGFLVSVGLSGKISEVAGSTGFYIAAACALGSLALLPLALVALWLQQQDRVGRFGALAFAAALVGTMLAVGAQWTYLFVVPYFAEAAPELVNESRGIALAGFLISYAALAVGWITFGVATMRTKLFPRWAAALLIAGGAISIAPMPSRTLVLALALALLGFQVLRAPQEDALPE